jgi:hypothetical protein
MHKDVRSFLLMVRLPIISTENFKLNQQKNPQLNAAQVSESEILT